MASSQDQLHSQQFLTRRVVSALVTGDPDAAHPPFRRAAGGTLAGILLAAVSLAGAAVYGLLNPGMTNDWRQPDTVVVERESGARFVYLDGRLHPVLNYASALLILGSTRSHTALVSRSALASAPRGAPLGLPGAPDSLPAPGQLLGMPWSVCAAASRSLLLVGHPPTGRRPPDGAGILIQAPDRALSLVWRGHRLPIPDPALVRAAFGWAGQPPVPVPTAFFNALQQGADLVAPVIPGTVGAPSRIARHKVGTVIVVPTQGGARQYAVVLAAGLAPISQVQADLLLSDPNQERRLGQTRAVRMSQAEFAAGPAASLPGVSLPATTPALVPPSTVDGAVCATFADESGTAVVSIDVPMPSPTDAVQSRDLPSGRGRGAVPVADLIVVPPGRGALIEAVAAPGGTGGALSLLTDVGLRYPLPTADVPSVLGYGSVRPVRVPAGLVALLPSGTALDPAAARLPAR